MIKTVFIIVALCSFVDVLVKEFYVKNHLWKIKYGGHWWKVNNFWKDSIDCDRWYRIRYAMVLNFVFMLIAGITTWCFWGLVLYLYLAAIYWEHIFYQWFKGIVPGEKFFDLHNTPTWLNALPWGRMLAKYHGEENITSEQVYTIAVLGTIILILVNLL